MTFFCPNCEKPTVDCRCVMSEHRGDFFTSEPWTYQKYCDVELKIKPLHPDTKIPVKAHESDACYDVFAYTADKWTNGVIQIFPGERALVPLGFCAAVPPGWEIQMRPRSGLALKSGLSLANAVGTVDAGYRNELCAILINLTDSTSNKPITIHHGDKVAQIKVSKVPEVKLTVVDDLDDTDRGQGGFGSTGNT